jgi:gas vesicle structural protein
VSPVGIAILTIDVRIVIASVDTYLRFAEAGNRLDIVHDRTPQGRPELLKSVPESAAKSKLKGLAEGVKEAIKSD